MAFTVRDNPDFSWSSSRSKMFEECALCYGLYYYGAHNGWLNQATPLAAAAYRYKVTRSTESMLHDSVASKIYDHYYKDPITPEAFLEKVTYDLNLAFTESKKRKDDWFKKPKQVAMLREMVDQSSLPTQLVKEIAERRGKIISNFYNTVTETELKNEHQLMHLSRFNKFTMERLDNLEVYVGVHLLYKRGDGKVVAVNFKTTEEESDIDHLGALAMYIMHSNKGLKLSDIVLRDEFLVTGMNKEYRLNAQDIEIMYDVIQDSVSMMAEHVVDGDLKRNQAIPLKEFSRNLSHSDTSGVANCPYCQMVKLDLEKFPNGIKSYAI